MMTWKRCAFLRSMSCRPLAFESHQKLVEQLKEKLRSEK